jgi:hypothetical protein
VALLLAQLTVHAAREHLDRRTLRRVAQIEADDLGRLARRRIVELEDRVPGGFEKLSPILSS